MEPTKRLNRVLSPPENSLDNIVEAVGDMHRGQMIQVQVSGQDQINEINKALEEAFPATEYLYEDFVSREVRYIYIYILPKKQQGGVV